MAVEVDVESGHAVLKPRKLIDTSQGWFWTKEWQKTKTEVGGELEESRCSHEFQTVEEGLKWPDK